MPEAQTSQTGVVTLDHPLALLIHRLSLRAVTRADDHSLQWLPAAKLVFVETLLLRKL